MCAVISRTRTLRHWWRFLSMQMSPDQVQEWKQEYPDDIHEVPVQAADLDRAVVLGGDDPAEGPPQHHGHHSQPDDHVERVEAGHHEIEREEDLCVARVRRFAELE